MSDVTGSSRVRGVLERGDGVLRIGGDKNNWIEKVLSAIVRGDE